MRFELTKEYLEKIKLMNYDGISLKHNEYSLLNQLTNESLNLPFINSNLIFHQQIEEAKAGLISPFQLKKIKNQLFICERLNFFSRSSNLNAF